MLSEAKHPVDPSRGCAGLWLSEGGKKGAMDPGLKPGAIEEENTFHQYFFDLGRRQNHEQS